MRVGRVRASTPRTPCVALGSPEALWSGWGLATRPRCRRMDGVVRCPGAQTQSTEAAQVSSHFGECVQHQGIPADGIGRTPQALRKQNWPVPKALSARLGGRGRI